MKDWDALYNECMNCTRCALSETRTNVVFGSGNRSARLMFIGEGPGKTEDEMGLPFVGRAGQLLDQMLTCIDVTRDDVYIANIVKCRPPGNRDPLPDEQDKCIEYLRNQVSLIKPRVIVCLGRVAAMRIIRPDYRITAEHGTWVERGKYLLTAIYHPAYLLRSPAKKQEAYDDLMLIGQKLRELDV